ncbi:MAG: serine/threonine-protein kinase, partial [Nocardioides sp.]
MSTKDSWRLREGDAITPELTVMRLLGGGSSYEAYLAFDEITYAPVVVKVIRPWRVTDPSSLRGLAREVRALAEVNHPVVVRGLRHELAGERPHVVLEHIEGPRLSSLIRRHGPLQQQQYLPLAIDVASALHYLRHLGYVHLDIKPSNIIMGAPARMIDLSVARTVAAAAELTHQIGTDFYMAPEQADPGRFGAPGPASDVWGLGTTLFHAVAGYRAFDEGDLDSEDLERRYPQLTEAPY